MQVKVMGSSGDGTTLRVPGWVSILGFISAVGIAVSHGLELNTTLRVVATCGERVTLPCVASSPGQLNIRSFLWMAKNQSVCSLEHVGPGVRCDRAPGDHSLNLTLLDVMPVHQGDYFCKVRSTQGTQSGTTTVTVQDCLGSSGSSVNESHARCWFSGVYPVGSIRWAQGGAPLAGPASARAEADPSGRYNVSSATEARTGESSEPYECSLWIPSARKTLSSRLLPLAKGQLSSSGSPVQLAWACAMVGVMGAAIQW
ncbi:uncharacterized protein LOC119220230 [Pungitius pungitius]|uniref:uncharacterized protein LOC119220230 n=1 Tax=Pungitius pungitius TaxID=134920 RepID=UPI002E135601